MLNRSGGSLGLNSLKRHYAYSFGQLSANNLETERETDRLNLLEMLLSNKQSLSQVY